MKMSLASLRKTKFKWTIKELIKRELRRIVIMFTLLFKRKFDGKTYKLVSGGYTRVQALEYANEIKEEGYKTHVIKTFAARWCVYIAYVRR